MPTNMTNMTIFMSPEYPCLRICNVDQICTCSKLIFQLESNKHCIKTGNQKHNAQRRKINTNRVVQRWQNHKNKQKQIENMWNHLFN